MQVEFIHENPRHPISARLKHDLEDAERVFIASGFLSCAGINFILDGLKGDASKIRALVVGAATRKALDAFDVLLQSGAPADRLRLHLGYAKHENIYGQSSGYRPMFHSKIILIERSNGALLAYIGSHNITGFAMGGVNGEACIRIEDQKKNQLLLNVFFHIKSAFNNSVIYSNEIKKPFLWWINRYYKGLLGFIDTENFNSITKLPSLIVLAMQTEEKVRLKDIIYMSIPRETLAFVRRVTSEHIHLYLFPSGSAPNIEKIHDPNVLLFACELEGVEADHGAKTVEASWEIIGTDLPKLYPVPGGVVKSNKGEFNEKIGALSQIRIKPKRRIKEKLEYIVQEKSQDYTPTIKEGEQCKAIEGMRLLSEKENGSWGLVSGLVEKNKKDPLLPRTSAATDSGTPFLLQAKAHYKLT